MFNFWYYPKFLASLGLYRSDSQCHLFWISASTRHFYIFGSARHFYMFCANLCVILGLRGTIFCFCGYGSEIKWVSYGVTAHSRLQIYFLLMWLWFLVESRYGCTSVVQVCYVLNLKTFSAPRTFLRWNNQNCRCTWSMVPWLGGFCNCARITCVALLQHISNFLICTREIVRFRGWIIWSSETLRSEQYLSKNSPCFHPY